MAAANFLKIGRSGTAESREGSKRQMQGRLEAWKADKPKQASASPQKRAFPKQILRTFRSLSTLSRIPLIFPKSNLKRNCEKEKAYMSHDHLILSLFSYTT